MTDLHVPGVTISLDPELSPALRRQLIDCWVDVSNAGGAVGFVPPVSEADVTPLADKTFAAVARRSDHLVVACDADGRLVGWLVLESRGLALCDHWRTLKRVQVHPSAQGRGYGRALLDGAARAARFLGLESLHLTVRGGTGTENLYRRFGYVEVGRIPRALRLRPDDVRDEVYMLLTLEEVAP